MTPAEQEGSDTESRWSTEEHQTADQAGQLNTDSGKQGLGEATPPQAGSAREQKEAADRRQPEGWLDRPNRPPELETTRPYDQPGGLTRPDAQHQRDVEDSVPRSADGTPQAFPDPRDRWPQLVNDGGPAADPLRGNNCLDCSLSLTSTWHGEPVVAAPRFPDRQPDGTLDQWTGEAGEIKRAERWLDHEYEHMGAPAQGLQSIEDKLRAGGHGSSANIVNSWRAGDAHAWNALNYKDEVLWVDVQMSKVDQKPLYDPANIAGLWAIVIDKEGKKL